MTSLPAFRRLQHDALRPLLLPEHVVLGEKLPVSLVVRLSRSSPDKTVPHSPASAAANVFFLHPLLGSLKGNLKQQIPVFFLDSKRCASKKNNYLGSGLD